MNHLLASLQAYPFERLKALFASVTPNPAYRHITLGIGEPRNATPQLVLDAMAGATRVLARPGKNAADSGSSRRE
jgi:N-succinyldiaminopimelate aminotransferase